LHGILSLIYIMGEGHDPAMDKIRGIGIQKMITAPLSSIKG
jgi:hypothetical protein